LASSFSQGRAALDSPSASDVGQPRGAATGVDASPSLDEHFLLPVAKNIRLWRWIQLVTKKLCSFFRLAKTRKNFRKIVDFASVVLYIIYRHKEHKQHNEGGSS
jgi:hypothetical protein